MATKNRIRVVIGLSVLGSFGWVAVRDPAGADEPRDASPPSAVASNTDERLLLLTNGQVIKGVVTDDGKEYSVTQRVGTMRFPKQRAEGVFPSIHEAYQHKVAQLPERDSDERIKLAHWCLNVKLRAEARAQLSKVLEMNPKHALAQSMLFSMDQTNTMAARRERDPEVQQTAAETMHASRPATLDSAVIEGAQRGLGISGMPVIFDLPRPAAIKRANEFARYVHPVLQAYCAKCHDEHHAGEFQLVPIRSRLDRTPDAVRANLDATLRLIDAENPSKSELLTSTLRPHGRSSRPIFPGSNDKTYQILSAWAQSLRNPTTTGDSLRLPAARAVTDPAEEFAAARTRGGVESPDSGLPALPGEGDQRVPMPSAPAARRIPPPASLVPDRLVPAGRNAPAPDEFPLPFALTGKMPNLPTPKIAPNAAKLSPNGSPSTPGNLPRSGNLKPGFPADANKSDTQANAADDPAAKKKKAKPVSIDPNLLERTLLYRNIGR
jgi:hypothetical protein